MITKRWSFLLAALPLLTACGTIMHGPRQQIDVQSSPSGAKIEASPAIGTFTTPTTLNLERKNSYVLTFSSPGYTDGKFNINNSIGAGTVIADVLLTGLVGVVVDGMTGSWYGLSPESSNVTLTRLGAGVEPAEIHVSVLRAPDGKGFVIKSDVLRAVQVNVMKR